MKTNKPLGKKAYGSIPHLPGSRRGPADIGLSEKQAEICTTKRRDKKDTIIVQEKLDGSCCSVAKINGLIIALTRAGYLAETSPFSQHHVFSEWVNNHKNRFDLLLNEGERCVGEWLYQAHGTRYDLPHEPFVIFDLFDSIDKKRIIYDELVSRCFDFILPKLIHKGNVFSIEAALESIEKSGHGAIDRVEGAVWRVERNNEVDFLAKYVVQGKVDGCYLPEMNGGVTILNNYPQ